MFNSVMIEVAIGMVFIFLMLSLVCAAVREAIEARLKSRSKFIAYGIVQLLQDPDIAKRFYAHPTVQGLYGGDLDAKDLKYIGKDAPMGAFRWIPNLFLSLRKTTTLPSYIPTRTFALTMLQMAASEKLFSPPDAPPAGDGSTTLGIVRSALARYPTNPLSQAMSAALITAENDMEKAITGLEAWFDASMDRVSGWYKRETQHILFWVGLVVAVALNVDTIYLTKYLSSNDNAREQLFKAAAAAPENTDLQKTITKLRTTQAKIKEFDEKPAATAPAVPAAPPANDPLKPGAAAKPATKAELEAEAKALGAEIAEADKKVNQAVRAVIDLNLPIGWNRERWNTLDFASMPFVWACFGWLLTAFGLSFGAPFWFDVLNRFTVIRSTVKPHEKSPEEGSQDHQPPGPPPPPAGANH